VTNERYPDARGRYVYGAHAISRRCNGELVPGKTKPEKNTRTLLAIELRIGIKTQSYCRSWWQDGAVSFRTRSF
jgi:hypothetical protein